MTNLKAGDRIPDVAAMDTLPVGAAVTMQGSIKLLTRHPEGWAHHGNMFTKYPSEHYFWEGIEVVSLPMNLYSGPMIGDKILTVEQAAALPLGTVLAQVSNRDYSAVANYRPEELSDNRRWQHTAHGRLSDPGLADLSRKDLHVVESLPVDLFETVEQFAWRLRDLLITGNERARGESNTSTKVLSKMGVEFKPTPTMRVTSRCDRDALAQSTEAVRIYTGNPEDVDSFAVWEKAAGTGQPWVKIFGKNEAEPRTTVAVIIDAIDGKTEPDEWFVAQPSETDQIEVAKLRAKTWRLGWQEKQDHGWCDEYERIMLRAGLTEDSIRVPLPGGVKVGEVLTVEQVAMQSLDSKFLALDEAGMVLAVFVRSDDSKNRAGTKRVWASEAWTGGHFAERLTLIATEGETGFQVSRLASMERNWVGVLQGMPVGTIISHTSSLTNNIYVKVCEDGTGQNGKSWNGSFSSIEQADGNGNRVQFHADAFGASWYIQRIGASK